MLCSFDSFVDFDIKERRHGKDKPVIKKALVELDSLPFLLFRKLREEWRHEDCYRNVLFCFVF